MATDNLFFSVYCAMAGELKKKKKRFVERGSHDCSSVGAMWAFFEGASARLSTDKSFLDVIWYTLT